MNKCSKLSEETHLFVTTVEEARDSSTVERSTRRRLENARRRLIRQMLRVCHLLTEHELVMVAEYMVLVVD
jgi:hypothetical protein